MEKIKLLLIDDDLISLESVDRFLSSEGIDVDSFTSIEKALTAAQKKNYNVIASDYKLGNITGIDLINNVKKMHTNIITILFTGLSEYEINEEIDHENIDFFFKKPIRAFHLIKTLLEIALELK